jgi:hypothetical protein
MTGLLELHPATAGLEVLKGRKRLDRERVGRARFYRRLRGGTFSLSVPGVETPG